MPPAAEIGAISPSRPLDNPRHERFCRLVVKGGFADWECYQIAYEANAETARTNSWRLRADEGIAARIDWLMSQAASSATLTNAERRRFLARVVRANITKLDPEADGDLLQEVSDTLDPETQAVTHRKVKLPGKRECLETDAKLAGEWMERPAGGDHSTRIQAAVVNVFGRLAGEMLEKDVTPTLPATCEEVKEAECSTQSGDPQSGPVSDTGAST